MVWWKKPIRVSRKCTFLRAVRFIADLVDHFLSICAIDFSFLATLRLDHLFKLQHLQFLFFPWFGLQKEQSARQKRFTGCIASWNWRWSTHNRETVGSDKKFGQPWIRRGPSCEQNTRYSWDFRDAFVKRSRVLSCREGRVGRTDEQLHARKI